MMMSSSMLLNLKKSLSTYLRHFNSFSKVMMSADREGEKEEITETKKNTIFGRPK